MTSSEDNLENLSDLLVNLRIADPKQRALTMDIDIFISYATPDLEVVTRLQQRLTAQGFTVWFDPDNDNNDLTHRTETHKNIENSQVFLLIQSPDSLASDKVREELSRAINSYAKHAVALTWRPAPVTPRAMRGLLSKIRSGFDFTEEPFEQNFENLAKMLRSLVPAKASPLEPSPPPSSPGRRLGALGQKKAGQKAPGIMALGAQVISDVVVPLDLPLAEQEVVSAELKWLFSAVDHLSNLQTGEIDPSRPIAEPLPETAQKTVPTADNRISGALREHEVEISLLFSNPPNLLTRFNTRLNKYLKHYLNREISMGEAGKGDPFLQARLKDERKEIVKLLQEIARAINNTYGVLIPSPAHLLETLEQDVNPLVLGSLVLSRVISPLGLPDADEAFVAGEIKWLFNAAHNFQQVYRTAQTRLIEEKKHLTQKGSTLKQTTADLRTRLPTLRQNVIARAEPVRVAIPPDAERSAEATNYVLNIPDNDALIYYLNVKNDIIYGPLQGSLKSLLTRIDSRLHNLGTLLAREAKMGEEGKRNVDLQNRIRHERGAVIQLVQEVARLMDEVYGVFVTTPDQVSELLENDQI